MKGMGCERLFLLFVFGEASLTSIPLTSHAVRSSGMCSLPLSILSPPSLQRVGQV